MSKLFYQIYKFVRAYKVGSFIFLTLFLSGATYLATTIRLEENIANIIPRDEQVTEVNKVFEGLEINNRLVVHLYYNDSSLADPDQLVLLAKAFSDSLNIGYSEFISEIIREVPDEQMQKMYDYYYSNLPFYLQGEDYRQIENRIGKEAIEESVRRTYKQLLSPVGIVTKMLIKDPLGLASFPLQRMRDQQLDNNFTLYQNHIVTTDNLHLVFFIALNNPPNETSNNSRLIEGINQLKQQFETTHELIKVEYFGPAAVAVANAHRIKTDIYITVSLALAALFVFISLFYRTAGTFLIVVTPGVFGAIVAIAFLAVTRDRVSAISLGVGSVLLGITIDYALHFFTHYKKEKDVQALFKDLSIPLLMSSVTTACAFLSLVFIRSTALQDLGIFAGVSVLGAVFYTLVFLPHMIRPSQKGIDRKTKNFVEQAVSWLAGYQLYKKTWAVVILVMLSVVSLFTWRQVSFENNMLKLNYMPDHLDSYQEKINAISNFSENNIYVAFNGNDLSEALQANTVLLEEMERLKEQDSIFDFYTLNNIIPSPERQKEGLGNWQQFWEKHDADSVVRNLNKASEVYGFRQGTFSAFANVLDKSYTEISQEDIETILSVTGSDLIIKNADSSVSVLSTIALSENNKPAVLKTLSKLPDIIILDKTYLTNKLVELLKEDFSNLVNISLIVVFLVILISYGRLELTLIAFLPILLSWLWVLGLMGWLGLTFNIVNIIICTFIFGLGIDYSIFVMRGLTQQYAYGIDNLTSYKKSIILSMVTTLLGIGVLAFAQHPALKSIAFLAIIGIFSVVFITFTVEHMLYDLFILRRKRKHVIPFTLASFFRTTMAFLCFVFGCLMLYVARGVCKVSWPQERKRNYYFHKLIRFFCSLVINVMVNIRKSIIDRDNINFDKPSVIISNHHSFMDILLLLMFNPKVVMVTNDWVYNSPLFGKAVQYADFIQASKGLENQLDKIKKILDDGYSIIVYPEGTRSRTADVGRFHKGAFFLAEHFKLDIQPVILHGTSFAMPRGDDFYLKNTDITVKFLPRIDHYDENFGLGYRERTKKISAYFKTEYRMLREQQESPDFFREAIFKNYIFKGPVLEWYIKIKYKLEGGYRVFHDLVPKHALIVDLGCGYGPMAYALGYSSEERQILGVDYDQEKISVAQNGPAKPSNINFVHGDVLNIDFGHADVFIVSDVLHYLTVKEQGILLDKMVANLNAGGKLIIRDGDSNKKNRHKGTELTEIFSTGSGFNKTRNDLNFISSDMIEKFAQRNNFKLEVIDHTRRTSNTIFVLTQN
ncbi:1-acyl-sn-glycerol-3-phosphate acyltransferase [Fulvivirga ulvae]|uniref:trifunctional MMPL family transporter/lysophospholipid acyltransferase/class I SAM-dependent methyltransferase n=1 Tax=Fulvivirga ulvae TaxID=2904245 RepID=UPI001F21DA33|nr:trifunctional MMPL family transporter/lysophospholipid acyltransferase/class I SAM-dependent methyltransferase [Fulvivirga ulvae]UII34799.1 1-acyl-sn-glycerol-3-phosphate acyltransferase [Fulvivirga ulvae]